MARPVLRAGEVYRQPRYIPTAMPGTMYGLLMMKIYLDEIADGRTDHDARPHPTEKRGTIALVDSGTFKVHALADLTGVTPITYVEFVRWHQVGPFSDTPIAPFYEGRTCYAYHLSNVRRLTLPVRLRKDPEAHMWIDIPDDVSRTFGYQRTLF